MLHVLLFIVTYCSGIIAAFTASPIYIFVVYQAVYFYYPTSRWWSGSIPHLPYSLIVVVIMGGLWLSRYSEYKSNKILSIPPFRWMYAVLALYVVSSTYAAIPQLHSMALENFVKMVIIISIAFKICDTDEKLNKILYGYLFGAWYISFYAFQTGRNNSGRVEGIGMVDSPDANGLAAGIAPSLVLCLYYFWTANSNKHKMLFAIAGVFIANAIVLINSRGAFLAVALSISFFMYHMFFAKLKKQNQKKMAVVLVVLGLIGGVKIVDQSFIERIKTMTSGIQVDEEQESGATRFIFWRSAWEMAKDHPLGAGFQGFNYYAPFYIPEAVNTGGSRNRTVHSSWFEALSEVGYLGLFTFVMLIYSSFKVCKKTKKYLSQHKKLNEYYKVIAIESSLIAFVVAMTFLNRMRAEVLYWCILFIAVAYNVHVLKHSNLVNSRSN